MQRGNDCAVREREPTFPKGFNRNIVAQLGAHLFQFAPAKWLTEIKRQSRYPAGM